ncbi:GNAT family N-acetyltransferase (plasmid) [Curtobacterium flaccumfaciens pv. flaccumfaciens]|uniref:GNAT family N-acetyltransferase n=1 Tax=Curtobacterium flaccumfaciens TaxID=2035 RepID=UPI003A4D6448
MTIRPATPADAAGCLALQREYFPDYVRTTGVSNLDTLRLATVIREAPADRSAWFVATHNDEVVGYAFGQPWTPRRESPFSSNCMAALPQVAVRDGFQGHGIGSALVTEVIGAMAHLGFEMIHAHIPAHLVRWYAAGGMNVLQAAPASPGWRCPAPAQSTLLLPIGPLRNALRTLPAWASDRTETATTTSASPSSLRCRN